uniref:RING-type domain-containing protein n=1 Tax=Meloidogyne enterolobii TaxID=390850 RepID=A0A6V7XSF3_MELEN|nr:unnamed protein product [Meloidogyne enterolobii]
MNQKFQKLIKEKTKKLRAENYQKDQKIISLETEIKKAHELFDKRINYLSVKLNNMYCKYLDLKKVSYKFDCCSVCLESLSHENVYTLKNCNHTFHQECITPWISEGSKDCPCCRVPATLTDIKQFYVEKASDSSDEFDVEFFQNSNYMTRVEFVKIKNKWKEIDSEYSKCCKNNCINTNNPIGKCIKGNGFGTLINDENIKYLVGNGGCNKYIAVYTEKTFNKPQCCFNYSLYYFEIKCKLEGKLNKGDKWMSIGLKNSSTKKYIYYSANYATILNDKNEAFKLEISFKNNDIFGCGLVYPPTNKLDKKEEFPYIFFTKNGKQIGKAILVKKNFCSFKPSVDLDCCSIEANFGNNFEARPFRYDISKHLVLKEFY